MANNTCNFGRDQSAMKGTLLKDRQTHLVHRFQVPLSFTSYIVCIVVSWVKDHTHVNPTQSAEGGDLLETQVDVP